VIRFHFVSNNLADLPVKRMCELVVVPRSSFYAWPNRTPSARERADGELVELIRDIHQRSRGVYGVPRIYGQLRRSGPGIGSPGPGLRV
jgi:putative transposase